MEALLEARLDIDPMIRARVLEALAASGDPRAFSALLEALNDPETAVVAAAAMRWVNHMTRGRWNPCLSS